MSIVDFRRKHPKLYRQVFTRGVIAERQLNEIRDTDILNPNRYSLGDPRHQSLTEHDLKLAFDTLPPIESYTDADFAFA